MLRTTPHPVRKRPRRFHKFQPLLSMHNQCEPNEYCDTCMAEFESEAKRDRPDHIRAVDKGKIIFLEDVVYEHHLGRKLRPTERVIHRDGDFKNNRFENLELVVIPDMES